MAQPNTTVPNEALQAEILKLQLEELQAQKRDRQKREQGELDAETIKANARRSISAEWKRSKAKQDQEQAACSHRLANGRPAVVGQRDMSGKTIFLCQICQGMKNGRDEFQADPKWLALAPSMNSEFIGGPNL